MTVQIGQIHSAGSVDQSSSEHPFRTYSKRGLRYQIGPIPTVPKLSRAIRLSDGISTYVVAEERVQWGYRTLTGRVREIPLGSLSHLEPEEERALKQNLQAAQEIMRYVQKIVFVSWNFLDRCESYRELPANERKQRCTMARDLLNQMRALENSQELAKKFNIGNCYEMASIGYDYAKGRIQIAKAKLWSGDHFFLIIGGDNSAVICDPWMGAYYPFSEKESYLRNYVGLDEEEFHTQVEPFDPKHHAIVITLGNLRT